MTYQIATINPPASARPGPSPASVAAITGPCSPRAAARDVPCLPDGRTKVLDRQETLFWEGDEAVHFYQVQDGMICLSTILGDGRRQILRFCMAGDVFGLAPTGEYDCTAEALTASTVTAHRIADLDRLDGRPNPLAAAVLRTIYRDLVSAQEQVLMLGRKTALEKLASFLVQIARRRGIEKDGKLTLSLPMKLGDVADYLGLAPETICRLLGQLRKCGILASAGSHRYEIRDWDSLREMSDAEFALRAA